MHAFPRCEHPEASAIVIESNPLCPNLGISMRKADCCRTRSYARKHPIGSKKLGFAAARDAVESGAGVPLVGRPSSRERGVSSKEPVDLLVVGGGVNGTGIARDAAGRGLGVILCEQDDLARHTSSASSKLIHGGLRYLEHYEFRLVREALIEREVLLRAAPHIIWPLRFILPHDRGQRPAWLIRLGLFLYDHLGGRKLLPASEAIDLNTDPVGAPLKPQFEQGFAYADCFVDDARLVVLNALDARERGAEILTRTRCTAARRANGLWYAALEPRGGGPPRQVRARALVNATGPWVSRFLADRLQLSGPSNLRLVKGGHIIVPRLYDHPCPYILQHTDRRIVFVIPYERTFSLIGTTDVDYQGEPSQVDIGDDEIDYLCHVVSRYFREPLRPDQVEWTYAGVRPLYDDANRDVSAITRDYVFDLDEPEDDAPLLSVFGGKITTSRKLAEHALDQLRPAMRFEGGAWTAGAPLPGGDLPDADFAAFLRALQTERPWLPADLARRYARAYGTRVGAVLDGARGLDDLGEPLGDGLYEAEVDYLVREEWAQTVEDILFRRSKLGLHVSDATAARLRAWLGRNTDGAGDDGPA
jgi:glycerol-3-phosphate dehydrogenase